MTTIATINQLTAEQAQAALPSLIALLRDSVEGGASVGFLPPLAEEVARDYWQQVIAGLRDESRVLLVARQADQTVGTVQLELAWKPNARHRGEIQKLLVLRSARNQGIARLLMRAIEAKARERGRTLLVLDTVEGDVAEQLYRKLGFIAVGTIPSYARNARGTLDATVVFYRLLDA